MAVKIHALELENVKRIRAVRLEPAASGLTIIGGKNNQGKTSVLDAIAWALGGEKYRPSQAGRAGSYAPPRLHITLSNGLVVDRAGKNSALKVTDPAGNKGGQQLLNDFVEHFALDLPKFIHAPDREKADTLLRIIGVGDQLAEYDRQEQTLYHQRHTIGQLADQKAKYAKEMTCYPDAPTELVSVSALIRQQQEILARNGENQRKREIAAQYAHEADRLQARVADLTAQLEEATRLHTEALQNLEISRKSAQALQDESTAELERNIADAETINCKVRANLDREKAEDEAGAYRAQYDALTREITQIRISRKALLDGAAMPLDGLSVEDGALTYQGQKWDNMSGSDQLRVSAAIVRQLNPDCGFVLLDKLEQMDADTLKEFGAWLEAQGLQAIATRVSTGGECSIIIEDGYVQGAGESEALPAGKPWKEGEF